MIYRFTFCKYRNIIEKLIRKCLFFCRNVFFYLFYAINIYLKILSLCLCGRSWQWQVADMWVSDSGADCGRRRLRVYWIALFG